MKIVKLNSKDFITNGLEFVVQSETETHYIGAPNYHIPKIACTVLSDAAIINHKAETSSKEILDKSSEPVLIAKAGEWVKIVDFGEATTKCFTINKSYKLLKDLSGHTFFVNKDDDGDINGWTGNLPKGMKFEKCSAPVEEVKEERIDKPIDKVTIERLDMVLRMCDIQLHHALIDKIIEAVELIEEKGEETSLMDVCKMQAEWKK